eukprot:PhF_6_TR26689/c0_g2_i2/m.38885
MVLLRTPNKVTKFITASHIMNIVLTSTVFRHTRNQFPGGGGCVHLLNFTVADLWNLTFKDCSNLFSGGCLFASGAKEVTITHPPPNGMDSAINVCNMRRYNEARRIIRRWLGSRLHDPFAVGGCDVDRLLEPRGRWRRNLDSDDKQCGYV